MSDVSRFLNHLIIPLNSNRPDFSVIEYEHTIVLMKLVFWRGG